MKYFLALLSFIFWFRHFCINLLFNMTECILWYKMMFSILRNSSVFLLTLETYWGTKIGNNEKIYFQPCIPNKDADLISLQKCEGWSDFIARFGSTGPKSNVWHEMNGSQKLQLIWTLVHPFSKGTFLCFRTQILIFIEIWTNYNHQRGL